MDLFIYFLKSSLLILAFFLLYYFLLHKDTYHVLKRNYLILGLLISIALPFITFTQTVEIDNSNITQLQYKQSASNSVPLSDQSEVITPDWGNIFLYTYISVVVSLLLYYSYKYLKLYRLISQTDYINYKHSKIHVVEEYVAPFSFLNHVVISKKDYYSDDSKMIITHEQEHIKQYHYIDIMFMNLFCIMFWFNPIIWLYKTIAVQNLEHLVDEQCINQLDNKANYQYLLVNASLTSSNYPLIKTNIFQPSIKQRIMMMNKPQTKRRNFLKSLLILPILALFFMSFQKQVAYKEVNTGNDQLITSAKDSLKKNEVLIVKITQDADMEYLTSIKEVMHKKYQINVKYLDVVFKDSQLVSLNLEVDSNDGFKASAGFKNTVLPGLYFYRDYSEDSKKPFGIGSLPLPTEIASGKNDSTNINTRIVFSPSTKKGDKANTANQTNYNLKANLASKENSLYSKIKRIRKFQINGKTYKKADITNKTIILKEYEFINDKKMIIKGDIIEKEEFKTYLKNEIIKPKDKDNSTHQLLSFDKDKEPRLMTIEGSSISKKE
jgi:beta-lactamase regulating signal transducer with metallopeptidase domain